MITALTIGFAIPAYRNADGLQLCLRSILSVCPKSLDQIYVVDDSGSGSVSSQLRDKFPFVHWIVHDKNEGFGKSANDAVECCPAEIVILLNDDVEVLTDPQSFLAPLFSDDEIFAVTFKSTNDKAEFREGAKRLVWRMGFPKILHSERDQLSQTGGYWPSSYAVGGHAAFRRDRFLSLGGFDPLFDPFYWEDVDLSWRAIMKGWRVVYEPACVVKHDGPSAIRSLHDQRHVRTITMRNRLLFAWRHISPLLLTLHAISIGYEFLRAALTFDPVFPRALSAALKRLSQLHRSRHQ